MRRGKATKNEEGDPAEDEKTQQEPVHSYETSIKTICTVKTVEDFWSCYNFMKRPNDLPNTTDYHFFRDGIKPTWEDPGNSRGGKWIIRLPKGLASRYWEEIVLAMIGGQFPGVPDGEICGAVVSIRYSEDILGIWNRTSTDREMTERIRDAIKKILQLPPYAPMEYKPHQSSVADKSSFRNTQVWKSAPRPAAPRDTRRSGSWGEREMPLAQSRRDSDRGSWR
jgi:translation initiation factor 4E